MCNWVAFAQTGVQCTSVHKARGLQAPLQGRWCSRLVQFATPTSQHPAPKAARRPGVFSQLQSFDVASLLALFRLSADALPGGRPQSSRRCGRRSARSFKACMWHHRIAAHRSAFARQKTKGIRGSDLDCTTRGLHHARFLFSAKWRYENARKHFLGHPQGSRTPGTTFVSLPAFAVPFPACLFQQERSALQWADPRPLTMSNCEPKIRTYLITWESTRGSLEGGADSGHICGNAPDLIPTQRSDVSRRGQQARSRHFNDRVYMQDRRGVHRPHGVFCVAAFVVVFGTVWS